MWAIKRLQINGLELQGLKFITGFFCYLIRSASLTTKYSQFSDVLVSHFVTTFGNLRYTRSQFTPCFVGIPRK